MRTRLRFLLLLFFAVSLSFLVITFTTSVNVNEPVLRDVWSPPLSSYRERLLPLEQLPFPRSSLLIDVLLLSELSSPSSSRLNIPPRIRIAVNFIEPISPDNYPHLDILFYENNPSTDYHILRDRVARGILKFQFRDLGGNLSIPVHIPRFLRLYSHSELRKCARIDMKRNPFITASSMSTPSNMRRVAEWRNELYSIGAYPALAFGTLLGWYRECTIIPTTNDMDMIVDSSAYSDVFHNATENMHFQTATLTYSYENPADGLEWKFEMGDVGLDMFFSHTEGRRSYTAGLDVPVGGTRVRWYYPTVTSFCSGDLLGHLFIVPCDVEPILEASYGVGWRSDPEDYHWLRSPLNTAIIGKYNRTEMERHIIKYN